MPAHNRWIAGDEWAFPSCRRAQSFTIGKMIEDAPLPGSQPLLDAARWVVESGLEDRPIAEMLAGLADRLLDAGIPITRVQIAFALLHPLFDFLSATWTRETGAIVTVGANDEGANRFESSPYYRMLRDNVPES